MISAIQKYNSLCRKVDKIFEEIRPNGGTSIKDSINRIETNIVLINERQRAILADTAAARFETDAQGICTWVNRTFSRLAQRTPSELYGHGWFNSIHDDDRERVVNLWKTAIDEKAELTMRFRFATLEGSIIPAKLRSYKLADKRNGEIVGYLGFIEIDQELI